MGRVSQFFAASVLGLSLLAAPAMAGCSEAGNSAEVTAQLTEMTNQFRRQMGLGKVRISAALNKAAAAHACDMARTGRFDHVGSNGSTVKTRTSKAGYRSCMVSENIAWGYKGADIVMDGWEHSPKHRENLTRAKARDIGIGLAYNGTTPYWVMVLASPC